MVFSTYLTCVQFGIVAFGLDVEGALVDGGDIPLPCLEVDDLLVIGEGDVPVVVVLVQIDVDGGFLSGAPGVGLVDPVT